jgi:selenide,water dikinase
MQSAIPLTRELVLVGGGHAHALVLRRWGMAPLPGVRLTVINPGPTAPYTGMLPGFVAGHYDREALSIDLVRIARFAGARLILGAAEGIDLLEHQVIVPGRPPIPFDIVSVNVGITSDLAGLPGFAEHAVAAKPLGRYARDWTAFRDRVAKGTPPDIAVIGGGVGGVELALAMSHALRADGHDPRITVIEKDTALPGLGAGARAALLANMKRQGIALREGEWPERITADAVQLQDGATIASHLTVGTAGARPHGWLQATGLGLTNGFVTVDATLRSVTDPSVYAVGDCAHLPQPRPKAGVYAVREAPILYHNLRADLAGTRRRRYRPQRDYLKLISLGGKSAVADKFGLRLEGPALWRWKDWIDQRFMQKFVRLPHMTPPVLRGPVAAGVRDSLADGKPLCGGCGAKVGGGALGRVLAGLPERHRYDVETRPGDDAAILRVGGARQVITTDHLRAFTGDPWVMARITAHHALGDIWAMGARPQAALATVILPRMTEPLQQAWLAEIMAAAADVFQADGAEIVGGHTSVGCELTIGFAVTGFCDRLPVTLAGARPGDALILTKPIGSGTILAAEMQMQARGSWVAAALDLMAQSQARAAAILRDAHAMTDVTGFGLAGHLMGMCDASGCAATLCLADVPLMDGASALARRGVRSTLFPANRQIAGRMSVPDSPEADLLFDPQTAGGLLAAVAPDQADEIVRALGEAGFTAARIGRMQSGLPFLTVT